MENINLQTTNKVEDPAGFIVNAILKQLELGKKVLFFVTGGSSVAVGIEVSKIIKDHPHQNLTVMLTDERYGPIGHPDSNWQQLLQKGFSLPEAKLIPVLTGDSPEITTEKFNQNLERELQGAEYKIGLFGVGKDGHTAGNLPNSISVNSENLAFGYDTPDFYRVTMTPKAIEKLDEVVVWMQGEDKWKVIEDLEEKEIDIIKQPAQILKKVPLLTIFSDYPTRDK
jgi:6-phosphogluconolactonase/glucosamine-6-phosphate isomerase/deaminase